MATLEPDPKDIHGGEHHSISFDLDEAGYLKLKVEGMCYGTHAFDFEMLLPSINPEQLDQFSKELANVADNNRS